MFFKLCLLLLRSPKIYDARNHQRKFEFPQETKIDTFEYNDTELTIQWKDGHQSKYDLFELNEMFTKKSKLLKPKLWTAKTFPTGNVIEFLRVCLSARDNSGSTFHLICIH